MVGSHALHDSHATRSRIFNPSIYLSIYLSIQVLAHLCTAVKGQVAFLCGGAAG